jgi:hypothetical protein
MKKLLLLAMVLGLLVSGLPFSVLAADMPDGFIGLKWGHSLDKMRDEGLFDRVIINDKNPDKQVAWVSTKRFNPLPNLKEYGIILYFYKDKLYAGSIMIKKYRDWNLLTEAIIEKYGTPFAKEMKNVNGNKIGIILDWSFKNGIISATYNQPKEEGSIYYSFPPKELRDDLLKEKREELNKVREKL